MAAVAWTIKIGAGSAVSLASLGLSNLTRNCRSGLEDLVTVRHDGAAVNAAPVMAYGDTVIIYRDGVKWFHGRCNTLPAAADGASEGHSFDIVGPWWWLEQIVYQQGWKLWDPAADSGAGALVTKFKSRVILCQLADGTRINTGEQVGATLDYAISLGAPIVKGTIDADVNIPWEEVTDVSCAEVVRRMMRWSPDHVAWFDYSTATPTLHIRKPASLGTLAYNITTDAAREALKIRPRNDLQIPGITLHYERTNTVDGTAFESFEEDTAGVTSDPRSVVATIELAGANVSHIRQKVVTEDWPADLNSKTWWKAHNPSLSKTPDGDLTITGTIIKETGGAPSGLYPRVLLEGQIQDWMDVEKITYTVSGKVRNKKVVGGVTIKDDDDHDRSFTVIATSAKTKTYSGGYDATYAEETPTGVAAKFYESWGRLHYEGQFSLVSEDVPAGTLMGNVLNLSGGLAAWASMAAIVYEVTQDVDSGTTAITFGPNKYLGLSDLIALLRTMRSRRSSYRHKARTTGESADKGGSSGNSGPVAKNESDTGYSKIVKQIMSSESGSTTRQITLDPQAVSDATGGNVEITAREVAILNSTATTFQKRQVLCSAAYGSDLGTISSALTVVTAVQYDTSTHQLQVKTRSVKAIDVGTESAWTEVVTFQPCP